MRQARGIGRKSVLESEKLTRANARRSLLTRGRILAGERFSAENVVAKRPASGISPMHYDALIGLTATCDLDDDTVIAPEHVLEDASFTPIDGGTADAFRSV